MLLVNIGLIQHIYPMGSNLLSLADASVLLGVSSERVRQLVVAGDLPGVRFGNAWAVPRDSVDARRQVSNRRGRPLSARRVWEQIAVGEADLSNVSRYRNRGEVHRYEMSGSDLDYLAGHDGVLVSGVAAAVEFGELLQPLGGEADLYVSVEIHEQLASLIAAVPDQLGAVAIRSVPADVWAGAIAEAKSGAGRMHAPRAAVALDLMESGDPRHWVAADNLIEARG
jgi:excisionase family DNA binding protein